MVFLYHIQRPDFHGVPLPQHLLFRGQTWWDMHTWRASTGNTVNDRLLMTTNQLGVKVEIGLISCRTSPECD